jgi:hypothetical protein
MTDNARYQLAGLASVDAVVEIAMRALVETYPAFGRETSPTDSGEVVSARNVVDLCARLLIAIDTHRRYVASHLPSDEHDWPF